MTTDSSNRCGSSWRPLISARGSTVGLACPSIRFVKRPATNRFLVVLRGLLPTGGRRGRGHCRASDRHQPTSPQMGSPRTIQRKHPRKIGRARRQRRGISKNAGRRSDVVDSPVTNPVEGAATNWSAHPAKCRRPFQRNLATLRRLYIPVVTTRDDQWPQDVVASAGGPAAMRSWPALSSTLHERRTHVGHGRSSRVAGGISIDHLPKLRVYA